MSHIIRICHTSMSHATRFHAATRCNTLHSTPYYPSAFMLTHCNTLQHTASCCLYLVRHGRPASSHCKTLQHTASCWVYHCNTQHHVECTLCVHDAVFCSVGCTASCWVYLVRHGRRADFTRLRFLLEEALRDIRPDVARQIDEDRVDPPRITPVVSRMRLECHTCVPTMSQIWCHIH